ncbi:MAG: type II secretion system protein, partial [Gemmatimonadales bacterium]
GFSFIELLVVLVIIGILANLVVPTYGTIKRRAEAAHIIGDMSAIRIAALNAYAATGEFPPTAAWGEVPDEFTGTLPNGFDFQYKTAAYRWRRWSLPNGLPADPAQTVLVGLEMQTTDEGLVASVKGLYRGAVAFGTSTQITFVLQ